MDLNDLHLVMTASRAFCVHATGCTPVASRFVKPERIIAIHAIVVSHHYAASEGEIDQNSK